jgi:nicotinate-nucleotide adenylyltransferase
VDALERLREEAAIQTVERPVVAIYGGSFDPPHFGHAMVIAWLLWSGTASEVWLVPTFQHAFDKPLAPFELRAGLCAALAETIGPRVRVVHVEASLPPPSYTIDTLDALAARHPDRRLRLVVGADVLGSVDQWRRWTDIEARYAPIVLGREGSGNPQDTMLIPNVSSTEIRRRMGAGEPVGHLVPQRVARLLPAWWASRSAS